MDVAARSRDHVESKLRVLGERYDCFGVNQTTLSLPADQYADVRRRGNPNPVAAYATIQRDNEILHVDVAETPELPSVNVSLDAELEPRLKRAVAEQAGIDCVIDDLEQVTIAGLRNADDPDAGTLYNLVVVFAGQHESGVPGENAAWLGLEESIDPVVR